MLKGAVVLLAMVCAAFAAVALAPQEEKPKKFEGVEGCYISELDTVIPLGKAMPSAKSCMEYRCGTKYVQYISCGAVGARAPCSVHRDESKPYPHCCPYITCDSAP